MSALFEGMRAGDLRDLVLPIISVDEFESKIDDSAVVLGFYVHEQGAADDLNRFIQRTYVDILDTEVSPAPDTKGYFMVFVEMLANADFASNVMKIVHDVSALVNVDEWFVEMRGQDETQKLSKSILKKFNVSDEMKESIYDYLRQSEIGSAEIDGTTLTLIEGHRRYTYEIDRFEPQTCGVSALNPSLSEAVESSRLQMALGAGWDASMVEDKMVLTKLGSGMALSLKKI